MTKTVIIHGWSDEANSFTPLAKQISAKTERSLIEIYLGEYISLEDNVMIADIAQALDKAWSHRGLSRNPHSIDVIVHSTGALVIREWIHTQFVLNNVPAPVRNLVMLAPANFGSPLAHKGRTFVGRVVKGFNWNRPFQTGTQVLKELEMASPYTWQLAERDRFEKEIYSPDKIRTTVIVGNTGYGGLRSMANAPGSDGTVYSATANLNCRFLKIKFPEGNTPASLELDKRSVGDTAFLVLDNHNHATVTCNTDNMNDPDNLICLNAICKAIDIKDANDFRSWLTECEIKTTQVMDSNNSEEDRQGYQNVVFRVRDDEGHDITDYVLEFYQEFENLYDRMANFFNTKVSTTTHAYSSNQSYRSFLLNCTELHNEFNATDDGNKHLAISLTAMPDFEDPKVVVGYKTTGSNDIGSFKLDAAKIHDYFTPNETMLVEVMIPRQIKQKLFEINGVV